MIAYRSNFARLPVPTPRPAAPVDGRKRRKRSKGKAWDEEKLACLQALIAQGLTPGAAARRMAARAVRRAGLSKS
jgi:hypothetical protein